jgi:cell division protein FtsQ
VIRRPEQVTIEGNHYLPAQTIQALLPIPYPQSLLRVEPQQIVDTLKVKAPIADVAISRRLFPPGLVIQVKERFPVAIAVQSVPDPRLAAQNTPTPQGTKAKGAAPTAGLLDEKGLWIPLELYTLLDQSLKMPSLKIIGNFQQYRPYWSRFYQEVSNSPIKISEIDWRDPTNLILKTDLGIVHLGSYDPQFTHQLSVLDQMRKLKSHPSFSQIAYIDLRDPDAPIAQMTQSKDPVKSDTP